MRDNQSSSLLAPSLTRPYSLSHQAPLKHTDSSSGQIPVLPLCRSIIPTTKVPPIGVKTERTCLPNHRLRKPFTTIDSDIHESQLLRNAADEARLSTGERFSFKKYVKLIIASEQNEIACIEVLTDELDRDEEGGQCFHGDNDYSK